MSTTNFGQGHTAQAQEAPVRGSGDGYRLRSRLPVTTSANENLTLVAHRELKAGPMAPPSGNFSQTVTTANTAKMLVNAP